MNAAALLLCALPPPAGVPEGALPGVRPSDVSRFPPEAVLRERVRFAGRHLAWLDARAGALGPGWAAREYEYREELVRRLELWQAALAAARAKDDCRAARLRHLRRGLGVVAYNRGELPELPPAEFFTRGD